METVTDKATSRVQLMITEDQLIALMHQIISNMGTTLCSGPYMTGREQAAKLVTQCEELSTYCTHLYALSQEDEDK